MQRAKFTARLNENPVNFIKLAIKRDQIFTLKRYDLFKSSDKRIKLMASGSNHQSVG